MLTAASQAVLSPGNVKAQNLIKKAHFVYKAFYGPWPLLRYTYFFHQSHQELWVAAECCLGTPWKLSPL